jgi:hypothetical protein
MLAGAGLSRAWPRDRAHRFFSRARWSADYLGLAVACLVARLLEPAGSRSPWRSTTRCSVGAVTGSGPHPGFTTDPLRDLLKRVRQPAPVGAGNPVTICDLGIFADQAAEPVPAANPDVCPQIG